MNFEFDDSKSDANKEKHGLDFVEAQELWNDPMLLEVPAKVAHEERFVIIGKIGDEHWSGIITYRGNNIRIISVRRSRRKEAARYESERVRQNI